MRVEPAIGVHADVEYQADVVGVGEDAVHEVPGELAEVLLALQNRSLPFWLTEMLVCMPLPLTLTTGLGKKLAVMPFRAAT